MLMVDCDIERGGMEINKDFIVDFGKDRTGHRPLSRDPLSRRRLHL